MSNQKLQDAINEALKASRNPAAIKDAPVKGWAC
jgi:hypothetical protein